MISKLLFILGYFKKAVHFLILSLIAVSLLEVIGVGVIIPFHQFYYLRIYFQV